VQTASNARDGKKDSSPAFHAFRDAGLQPVIPNRAARELEHDERLWKCGFWRRENL